MKKLSLPVLAALFIMLLSSCQAIGGIFHAGMVTGIILVVVVVALIIWVISRIF